MAASVAMRQSGRAEVGGPARPSKLANRLPLARLADLRVRKRRYGEAYPPAEAASGSGRLGQAERL
jgi:hypothetical protein